MNKTSKSTQKLTKQFKQSKKSQQFFKSIEDFHNTLCFISLDSLLTTKNHQKWIEQQFKTYQHINNQLIKYQKYKQYQYYLGKVDSISKILKNINDNLLMLTKIKQCNYYSGTSSNSSSINSPQNILSQNNINTTSVANSNLKDLKNGLLSFDKYEIKKYNHQQPNHSLSEDQQVMLNQVCNSQRLKYQQSIRNILTKRNNSTTYKQSNNQQTLTKQTSRISSDFDTQKLSDNIQQEQFIRTIHSHPQKSIKYSTVDNKLLQQEEIILLKQQIQIYRQQLQQINGNLKQKNNIIENLLINNQSLEQIIQGYKNSINIQQQQNKFLIKRINIIQQINKNIEGQIQSLKKQNKQLININQNQKSTNQYLSGIKVQLDSVLYQKNKTIALIQQKNDQLKCQVSNITKQLKIQREKTQIYKHKYYNLLREQKQNHNSLNTIRQKHKKQINQIQFNDSQY